MTVDLLIRYKGDDHGIICPIAASDFFRKHWVPVFEALNLHSIWLYETAKRLTLDEVISVLNDLSAFRKAIDQKTDISQETRSFIFYRVDYLVFQLENAVSKWSDVADIYI